MPEHKPELVRAIGRWSMVALVVNSIIGSGVFGLPSVVAGLVGAASPWAVVLAGVVMAVIIACFAEVGSQFSAAGGPYLYARTAFGRLIGIEVGWMLWLAQLAAPAANANLFIVYLGEFWSRAAAPIPRFVILSLLVGVLALVNYRGVRAGTQVNNLFTVAKLLPLTAVAACGVIYLLMKSPGSPTVAAGTGDWLKALLLLAFAYGGFETALAPMSEASNPRKDVVFALFAALITCTLLYSAIQWTVVGTVADAAHSSRPLADAARVVLGPAGAVIITVGALISFYGYLSAKILALPRVTLALAEEGDFPRLFAAIHPRFRTPYFSIVVFALLVWLLALGGSFAWNLTLSAVARLFYYAVGCAALPVLRRKQPQAVRFRLPGGPVFALLGVIICALLVTRVDLSGFLILMATVAVGLLNWLLVRGRKPVPNPVS